MNKVSHLTFMLVSSFSILAFAAHAQTENTGNFELNQEQVENYQLKETIQNQETPLEESANKEASPASTDETKPQIVREDTPNGYVEKVLSPDGKVIAEKVVENDKVIKNILNYYSPEGYLSRQITASEENNNFYAEEFYPDGKVASSATYLNENNKIGKEQKYDNQGVLRQEITWMLPKKDSDKPAAEARTIRYGNIITYYPNGSKAAEFAVGKAGLNTFYNKEGQVIKQIRDTEILNFSRDLYPLDCQDKAVQLSLEELVELYEDEGDISYNKCGLPYREAFVYEILDANGKEATKISYDETGQIRRLTPYVNGKAEGVQQKFDASGNLSAEITYKNGQKDGTAVGYFPTLQKAFQKEYREGKVIDTLKCYFPNGEIAAEFHYENGLKEGIAQINSPVSRELEFSKGELLNQSNPEKARQLASRLETLDVIDEKCLKFENRTTEILANIENYINEANAAFDIQNDRPCQDLNSFHEENGVYACYDENNKLRAQYTPTDGVDGFLNVETYTKDGEIQYNIPYFNQKPQGFVKKFDVAGNLIAEVYYDLGEPQNEARSYYETGAVKEMQTQSKDVKRKILTKYNKNGALEFSISYKDGKKNQVFITDPAKDKDIYIRYYEGELDNVREANAGKPFNYIEYNLALGEYTVNREGELIRGGHLCQTSQPELVIAEEELSAIGEAEIKALDEAAQKAADDYNLENAVIPTEAEKKQTELAAKNIGPVAKPDIEELTSSVAKESVQTPNKSELKSNVSKTEKFYYPNGNLRKTVKAKDGRTEEIKEYSKSGLLLKQTTYNNDAILIEKYYGSGHISRKTNKTYDDNAVMAFVSREDFYDNGTPRYAITRLPDVLLFEEKVYNTKGELVKETTQKSPLATHIKEYDKAGNIIKQTETFGNNKVIKEYDDNNKLKSFSLNGKKMPQEMAQNSDEILKNNAKVYNKGAIKAEIKSDKRQNTLVEYHPGNIIKTEVVFYNNGEISVKGYAKDGTLTKFAYLAADGKLQLQKPAVRTIPNYRERYWIDYNNPNWVENQDKYSVSSINKLYLNTALHIFAELDLEVPEILKKLYELY